MRIKSTWAVVALAAAALAAGGITAVPTAAAAPAPLAKICVATTAGTTCQSPGNIEIVGSTPPINFYPYGTMPYLLGGN